MSRADSVVGGVTSSVSLLAEDVRCAHCALVVAPGHVRQADTLQFCCAGCRTAYTLLHDHGLAEYYRFSDRASRPVRSTGRTYEEFDHAAFRELYVRITDRGLARVELYLEGVHCASCLWLVERVPLLVPGVATAELDVRRSLAVIEWDLTATPLSQIARALESLGYPPHPFRGVRRDEMRRREDRTMMVRIGVSGAIAANVMLAALALYSGWLSGMEAEYEDLFRWMSLALTVPCIVGPGRVFFASALAALRTRALHMDVPIALALGAGFVRGAMNTISGQGPIYFDGVCALIFLLLVGRFLQQRGQRRAADAAELLFSLTPNSARVVNDDGSRHEVPAEALLPGMVVEVRAGESLPADGIVVGGRSAVNLALLTGESRPHGVEVGAEVFAGTLNVSAPLEVQIVRAGEESRLARILRQVESSAARRAPIVQLADRLSGYFVAVVLTLAVITFFIGLRREPATALDNAIALLIVTCPCALALATPFAITSAVGRAARRGLFIKGGDVLELLSRPSRLFLDKTGTITAGRTALVSWHGPEWPKPLVLSLEAGSSHPIAEGFRRAWPGLERLPVTDIQYVTGGGMTGRVAGRVVAVGSPAFVRSRLVHTDASALPHEPEDSSLTPVHLAVDGELVAVARFGDPVRDDSASAIAVLRSRGWHVSILSGDASEVAASVGREVGIAPDECVGNATPEEKLRRVEAARAGGAVVMVGDGVNDAAAIAAASVGIGVHGGAEASLATADVYLTTPGLSALVELTDGAARTMRVIRRNIVFSLVYNVIGAVLAMTGVINPLIAAIMMPVSSLTVILGSWYGTTFQRRQA